ncbi:OLC1v1003098C1 [Oldenlandia corymbosa var. corymbosa]|uniref:OLC1v1003098C1 n=1 Tax=Oldenlandia corymbosa var. corymbosa TaxID=529605 RepID=A0AAV1DBM1_OLDCO|nr:OLC1v1003098C1 [Oldenlandia corymbosa var. corymbosa]
MLKQSVYHFDGKPFITKEWSAAENINMDEIHNVPVWIQLPKLTLRYWSPVTLSKLASMIGRLLEMDDMTSQKLHTAYARILVEVEIKEELKEVIWFQDEKGNLQEQVVKYEWEPVICKNCKGYGHERKICRAPIQQDWKAKALEQESKMMNEKQSVEKERDDQTVLAWKQQNPNEGIESRRLTGKVANSMVNLSPEEGNAILTINQKGVKVPKRRASDKQVPLTRYVILKLEPSKTHRSRQLHLCQ